MLKPKKEYLELGFGGGKHTYKQVKNMTQSELANLYNLGFSDWFEEEEKVVKKTKKKSEDDIFGEELDG